MFVTMKRKTFWFESGLDGANYKKNAVKLISSDAIYEVQMAILQIL